MHRKLPHLGEWIPGRTNYLLLTVQVLFAVQGAARGMDYVLPRPPMPTPPSLTSIEDAFPLPVWGAAFLLAGGAVLVGLFGGWISAVIAGHVILAGLYGAFSYGVLADAPVESYWLALCGCLMLAAGLWLGVRRYQNLDRLRFAAAMLLTGVGGWTAGLGLGYNFRTGTGLLIAGIAHAALAVGTLYVAARVPTRRGR